MPDKFRTRERYGEAFWRKHHEAWQQSALNQREYCEAQGIPLKAFGNWRAKFRAEPQPPASFGGDLAKTALQQRPESAGRCALGIPRKAGTPQRQASRAETVHARLRPRAPASVARRSHHGFQHPD